MSDQARTAPSAAEMEALARAALARIPEPFAGHLSDIVLLVEEFADEETLAAMEMEPYELTGLYHGSPVGEKSMFDGMRLPDRIHLYRQPLLAEWCETGVDLRDLIRHVVVHEVGHHFGLSDDDMHALEDAD
ncbi:metallopeptidase family protein [Sphingomonas sp. Leaf62]|uniref:metallopeptidase family protein n=1 Tax=Sphingomonas sp. Leaf62 TaxID=1736228 RepID=UPI0006FA6B32|nr:metallopeptidase family protein [Sphingomonas sp. Leaf62]KQN76546.1 neutral zinc metallopeptidase [Sphingomonas sp. Leaf62]